MVRYVVVGLMAALCAVVAARGLNLLAAASPQPPPTAAVMTLAAPAQSVESGEASIAKSADGHFWADATVDGHPVRFLIDTGSTAVALTADDARSLGIDPDNLDYAYTVMTANGPAHAAPVKLGDISVDHAEVEDVQALVIDQGLPTSLLGMSYLGRLAKFEATPDTLVLRS